MKSKRNIALLYAIALLQGMIFYAPIATLYRQAVGVSVFQITIIESISLALCLLLELPWGIIADKIGYRQTMLICCGLYFISKIVFLCADGFGMFLAERIILSVVISGLSGVDTSMLYLSCKDGYSQRVFGVYNNLSTLGTLFAALVFALFLREDYRLSGFLTVISYFLAALLAFFLREPPGRQERTAVSRTGGFLLTLRTVFKTKGLISLLISIAFLNETHQTVTVFLSQVQYAKCGIGAAQIGFIFMAVTVTGLLGVHSATLTKRFGALPLAAVLFLVSAAACTVMALTESAALAVASVILLRLAFSLFQPLQLETQNRGVVSANRATVLSINSVLISSVGVGTNLVFGKLADTNLSHSLLFGGLLCLGGFVLFSLWHKHGGKKA